MIVRRAGQSATSRRAFTVLELVLAVAVASMVALAAFSVLTGLQNADARLEVRTAEQAGLGRTQIAVRRALLSLALSPEASRTDETEGPNATDLRRGLVPRVALEADPLVPGAQRLVLAVHRAPVDDDLAAAMYTPSETLDELAEIHAFGASPLPEFEVGAFVLRPDDRAEEGDLEAFGEDAPAVTYTLWWVPGLDAADLYPPAIEPEPRRTSGESTAPVDGDTDGDGRADQGAAAEQATREADAAERARARAQDNRPPASFRKLRTPAAAGATPLCRGITACRWRFYHRRVMKDTMLFTRNEDMPAFAELTIETATGLYASWMFELDYALVEDSALEFIAEPAEDGDNTDGGDDDDEREPPLQDPPGSEQQA
ncbi:MAG: hypothetical protein AAF138_02835 [Planctomycetota bacterium]